MRACPEHSRRTIRCAIYTRKSSEEGLEQGFNSLDAQREACAAYILSQASEGWSEIADRYDDGGLSGGTLDRPALQRLLADVAARRIDIIVVYKVDRLTRSLLDFAKLVEAFDTAEVSFVSITQSFNTTTSMGRLTLNMLLSFAQFEREVTAERIRDKIAASKAKGMWMGGNPPIGYRPNGRSLTVIESEADQIRDIFQRYLALGNVRAVADALIRDGITTPPRINGKGRAYGGCHWSRGQIYKLLSNPIYLGLIEHKGTRYPGLHPAIIDQDSWKYAQAKLAENLQGRRTRVYARDPSLLAGKVTHANGEPLIPVHASKSGDTDAAQTRYRYYVSKALHHGDSDTGMRIPARELEGLVVERVAALFDDPLQLMVDAALDIDARQIGALDEKCREVAAQVRQRKLAGDLIRSVQIQDPQVEITLDAAAVAQAVDCSRESDASAFITVTVAARLTRSGRVMRLVHDGKIAAPPDRAIVGLLVRAHGWWNELRVGELDVGALARRDGISGSYLTRVLRLAFLSPEVTQALLNGRQGKLDSGALIVTGAIDPLWRQQMASVA